LLRALAYEFNLPVSFAAIARPIAEEVLEREGTEADQAMARRQGIHPTGVMKNDKIIL
jgi:hypothetical protein